MRYLGHATRIHCRILHLHHTQITSRHASIGVKILEIDSNHSTRLKWSNLSEPRVLLGWMNRVGHSLWCEQHPQGEPPGRNAEPAPHGHTHNTEWVRSHCVLQGLYFGTPLSSDLRCRIFKHLFLCRKRQAIDDGIRKALRGLSNTHTGLYIHVVVSYR